MLREPESGKELSTAMDEVLATWRNRTFYLWDVGAKSDLGQLGFHHLWTRPWFVRHPAPWESESPCEIEVSRVQDDPGLLQFEKASKAGFESKDDLEPWYARSTLGDEHIHYVVGHLGDDVVVSGVTYASADMVGIYGISTPPEFRRRGYGRFLVEHFMGAHAGSSLGVWPDPVYVSIYTDSGFLIGGEIAAWVSP